MAGVGIQLIRPADWTWLQGYIRSLSAESRHNRFLDALVALPEKEHILTTGRDRFTVLATRQVDGRETILGEGCYALDGDGESVELALSVGDPWQGDGIGSALAAYLERHARASGAGAYSATCGRPIAG